MRSVENPPADVPARVAEVAALLRARGERMTEPRRAVVEAMCGLPEHVAAEDVVAAVAERAPQVHRASVYRALELLVALGVVQHVHVGHGATTYHLVGADEDHLHARCTGCGAVLDLPPDLLDGPARRLLAEVGFHLDAAHVALAGTCARCAAAGRP